MTDNQVNVALIGLGTIGAGVVKILTQNHDLIYRKTGLKLKLTHAVDIDPTRGQALKLPDDVFHTDVAKVIADPEVSVAIELIGGTTIATEITKKLLAAGKHVVTANKAMLAECGEDIYATARKSDRCVAFEASCCGGIPLVSAIRSGLPANHISAMYGIVNGTCNYILSAMSNEGKEYDVALKEAQQAGFAEADPTLDINGSDSAHKLAILASLAFGYQVNYEDIPFKGIDSVNLEDIRFAQEMGYAMKLLAIAEQNDNGLSLRIHPSFISTTDPLAQVNGAFNAMSIFGEEVGHTLYYGRGAGMMPTASAVVADVIEVARGNSDRIFATAPAFGQPAETIKLCPEDDIVSRFYLRLSVVDQPGVIAQITKILGDKAISISACLQHESQHNGHAVLVIMTHSARQGDVRQALAELEASPNIKDHPVCIHVATPPLDE